MNKYIIKYQKFIGWYMVLAGIFVSIRLYKTAFMVISIFSILIGWAIIPYIAG